MLKMNGNREIVDMTACYAVTFVTFKKTICWSAMWISLRGTAGPQRVRNAKRSPEQLFVLWWDKIRWSAKSCEAEIQKTFSLTSSDRYHCSCLLRLIKFYLSYRPLT